MICESFSLCFFSFDFILIVDTVLRSNLIFIFVKIFTLFRCGFDGIRFVWACGVFFRFEFIRISIVSFLCLLTLCKWIVIFVIIVSIGFVFRIWRQFLYFGILYAFGFNRFSDYGYFFGLFGWNITICYFISVARWFVLISVFKIGF